jgi:hypothetical protein
LHHVFYSDGNAKKVSWVIQTGDSIIDQNRDHADIYKNKVTDLQSKYVALHIGLFWGIGTFIIKNEDSVKIKFDDKEMFNQFTTNSKIKDEFIQKRMQFIKQLVNQRKLEIQFKLINVDENLAKKKIQCKKD